MLARNEGGGMDSVRLVSWNVAGRYEPWRELVKMGVDVALLQETGRVPPDVAGSVEVDPNEPWLKHQFSIWPKIVKLSDRVKVEWFKQVDPISETKSDEMSLAVRERSVCDRMEALGLKYLGPQFPAGRRADQTPAHLPEGTCNVPTSSRTGVLPPPLMSNSTTYSLLSGFTNTSTSVR